MGHALFIVTPPYALPAACANNSTIIVFYRFPHYNREENVSGHTNIFFWEVHSSRKADLYSTVLLTVADLTPTIAMSVNFGKAKLPFASDGDTENEQFLTSVNAVCDEHCVSLNYVCVTEMK